MALGVSTWRNNLDQRLRKVGEDIVITRNTGGTSTVTCTCRALVRTTEPQEDPRGLIPAQVTTPLSQPDMRVIISGTELDAAGWPLTNGLPLPLRTDTIFVAGKNRTAQVITPVLVDGKLVRIEMTVRG